MTEDRDVKLAARVEQSLETQSGKGASKLLLAAFGLVTTALLASINLNLHASNELAAKALETAQSARDTNFAQERDIALTNTRVDAIDRKADATDRKADAAIAGLQELILQVTKNHDAIEHNARGKR